MDEEQEAATDQGRHNNQLDRIERKQDQILGLLRTINQKEKDIMAFGQETLDLLKQVDAATNDVAARLQTLTDRLVTAPTEQEKNDIKAAITAELDRLKGMGKDPNNPLPPPPTVGSHKSRP